MEPPHFPYPVTCNQNRNMASVRSMTMLKYNNANHNNSFKPTEILLAWQWRLLPFPLCRERPNPNPNFANDKTIVCPSPKLGLLGFFQEHWMHQLDFINKLSNPLSIVKHCCFSYLHFPYQCLNPTNIWFTPYVIMPPYFISPWTLKHIHCSKVNILQW